ncbi:N-acetylglucosaminyldiphosphoundecaprenol N-acetyl-beta-D-mannosaminyltransferase [Pontiella desulfatans]|uniref:N-acetylglucosaminyldiphosphoundecaprenol N-acetyl-beta-D-mannosaminyltransferase n=1 Tax=Pontiella desulfatans TaxID=2750659 RepID=A0A6C2U7B0_PONDE|nr:WecB/TagA/CpsF family glycosyltransferase [Pontiella desulfatans]VGO15968.1 N-acetylglucosaminyldiphosphoundecaprenol N-acetyl-beta-D-mannosaminyltransferase [Pontiella desulfatans]
MQSDGSAPIPLVIYGVPFHNVTFEEAIDWIVERVRSGRPANIATANLDFVTRAWSDPELQRILIDADLVLADGFPIVKLAPFFGPALKDRVTGSDLTPMLAERAAREGMSIYGLGSAQGVAEKAMDILKKRHPDLKVAGTFSPPFAPLLEMDHRKILQKLERAGPDILFVALGAPKQDKFISMHVRGWNVPVAMGVGASLDFITGEQRRAPLWMRKHHLEWFWRICCNPRRLLVRYLENVRFLLSASRQMYLIHRMADKPRPFEALEERGFLELEDKGIAVERFQGFESESAARGLVEHIAHTAKGMNLLLDLHAVPWLDSLELGALLEINKLCRSWGKRLILYAPRPKVLRLLETCRLTDYFNTATRLDEVEAIARNLTEHLDGGTIYEEGSLKLELPMELTSATLPSYEKEAEFIRRELKEQGILKTVEVDAAQLDFIDSSGLGFLIALKKTTQDEGVSMSIANLPTKPRRTFEIARVDKVLLHA